MVGRFEYAHQVVPEDIDQLGHAGNYHYIRWLQHAAVAHSTANGWSPERYEELGAGWVVRSHQITYLKPAFEGDAITVRTWVSNLRAVLSLRHYEILDAERNLLARAKTDWAFVDYAKQKPTRVPQEVIDCFTQVDS